MITRKKHSSGLTLLELVITLLIGGILFLTIGAILVYTNEAWQRAVEKMDIDEDYRYALKKLEYELRGATTEPLTRNVVNALDVFYSVTTQAHTVKFQKVDAEIGRYVLNRVRRDTNKVIFESWWASTQGSLVGFPDDLSSTPPDVSEVILRNVREMQISLSGSGKDAINFGIAQDKTTHLSGVITSTGSFTVKTRTK